MIHKDFDEAHVLHELKHYLPSQTPLKDFIHHNSLHAFQNLPFYDAIFKASKIFGYQVTLQLTEFRELYKIGRINDEVLERVISEKMGKDNVDQWKEKLLQKEYDTSNVPRIGLLRNQLKIQFKIDL
ncbi:putative inorganic carbon transporter subunit DabA, partial [Segetibacter sp.]|uniref:putative inorganic carbon transporter subunit DabA n=1 Tax=Segetibacter sp. TaxID=2231182 RepID=UPI0026345513